MQDLLYSNFHLIRIRTNITRYINKLYNNKVPKIFEINITFLKRIILILYTYIISYGHKKVE